MSVKRAYLPLALAFISICLSSVFVHRIIIAVIWLVIFNKTKTRSQRLETDVLIILLLFCSIPLSGSHIYSGRVDTVKPTYLIVSDGLSRVMVYYQGEAGLDDVIIIDQDIEPVAGNDNFDVSTFSSWAKGNNIIGQLNLNHYQLDRQSSSLRNLIYQRNLTQERSWINELLFGNGMDVDSDYRYLIVQSGLHISFLAAFIKRLVSYFFYQDKAALLTIAVMTLLAIVFHFPFAYLRVLISLCAGYLITDQRNCLAAQIIVLCLLKPYYVCSLSFLIPIGLKLIQVFSQYRHNLVNRTYLILIQLGFYGYANLFSILFFPLFSRLAGCLYLAALLFCLSPLNIDLSSLMLGYLKLAESMPVFNLTGKPAFPVLVGCLILLFRYLASHKRLNMVFIFLLLVLNAGRRLLCPFYVITQLDVGQGDCCLITMPFSCHGLLIDAAGNLYRDLTDDIILPYLYSQAVRSADIIITHDDYDHCGSLERLQEVFKVRHVYRYKQEVISCGALDVWDPLYDRQYEDPNDNSLISYFAIDDFRFLYLGDVSARVESDLVDRWEDLQVDILKISHHGSISATSEKLLGAYDPAIALISAGKNNYYDHPHLKVLERLAGYQVRVFSTRSAGAIRMIVMRHLMVIVQPAGMIGVYRR